MKLITELLIRANIFGFGEMNQYNCSSMLMSAYKHIDHPQFMYYIIKEKAEIYNAMKTVSYKFSDPKESENLLID